MKTLLKLIIVLTTFGFATASAALTEAQKAAIKIVTDAVETGTEEDIKTAVNNQIALFPKIAAEIVTAALKVPGVSDAKKKIIIRVAAFTAPDQLISIRTAITAIYANAPDDTLKNLLYHLATDSAGTGTTILNAVKGNTSNTNKSLISFN